MVPASKMRRQSRPVLVLLKQGRPAELWKRRKAGDVAVRAAVSEDLVRAVSHVPAEKGTAEPAVSPAKINVRAVVTVRQKNKEDLKETIVKHLDAFTDRIGMNVVLQLVSTELDPSNLLDLNFLLFASLMSCEFHFLLISVFSISDGFSEI